MTKLLNLNQLSPKEVREVRIGDKLYSIKEMSVEDFIETTRVAEAMETEMSYAKQLNATIGLVRRSIPDISESVLLQLSLEQLRALTAFVRGEDPEKLVNQEKSVNPEQAEAGNG